MQAPAHFQGEGNLGQSWLTRFYRLVNSKMELCQKKKKTPNNFSSSCSVILYKLWPFFCPPGLFCGVMGQGQGHYSWLNKLLSPISTPPPHPTRSMWDLKVLSQQSLNETLSAGFRDGLNSFFVSRETCWCTCILLAV